MAANQAPSNRDVLNEVGRRIGYPTGISDGERSERAVIALLETLRRGKSR